MTTTMIWMARIIQVNDIEGETCVLVCGCFLFHYDYDCLNGLHYSGKKTTERRTCGASVESLPWSVLFYFHAHHAYLFYSQPSERELRRHPTNQLSTNSR